MSVKIIIHIKCASEYTNTCIHHLQTPMHILSGPDSKSMAAEDMKKSMTQSSVVSDGAIMMMV